MCLPFHCLNSAIQRRTGDVRVSGRIRYVILYYCFNDTVTLYNIINLYRVSRGIQVMYYILSISDADEPDEQENEIPCLSNSGPSGASGYCSASDLSSSCLTAEKKKSVSAPCASKQTNADDTSLVNLSCATDKKLEEISGI